MWRKIFDFCEKELLLYVDLCIENDLDSSKSVLTSVFKVILQNLSPILPFLAEEIFTKGFSDSTSIFEEKIVSLPPIFADENQ